MASTRRTRGRPGTDDEPLVMLPPKKTSKPRLGKKRRVTDLMSGDDDEAASLKHEGNEEHAENLQIDGATGMEIQSGTLKIEMDEDSTKDQEDHTRVSKARVIIETQGGIKAPIDDQGRIDVVALQDSLDSTMPNADDDDEENITATEPIPLKRVAKRTATRTLTPDTDDIIDDDSDWDEEFLMTNPNSVYGARLTELITPDVWGKMSDEDRKNLMKYLPECDKVYEASDDVADRTSPKVHLVDGFWSSKELNERIGHVQTDISDGKYTSAALKAIKEARKLKQSEEFDRFKENKFEAFWGQKQRVDYNAVAGDTTNVKLKTLAKHAALRVGDVFTLRRSFAPPGRGETKSKSAKEKKVPSITIEKDAKLIAIDPEDFSLTFSYPPGKHQVSIDGKPDKIIDGVFSITALETRLCREDGRAPAKLPNGNAWKTFRVKRNEQDIGSLFDVRMEFHSKYLS